MKSIHDVKKDLLRVNLTLESANVAPPEIHPEEGVSIYRTATGNIAQIDFERATARGLVPVRTLGMRITARQGWDVFVALLSEYNWPTKWATLLLLSSAAISIGKEFPCILEPFCASKEWLNALSSDGMLTILSLVVAFCIGIHIKLRLERGLVDGAEHYSVGRALAYGYFSNFIIGVLLTLRAEGERQGLPQGKRPVMHVIFPRNVADLEAFRGVIEKNVKLRTESRDIVHDGMLDAKLFKRSLLTLTRLDTERGVGETFYLDFPTTLYTMQDYIKSWNIWLRSKGRELLPEPEIERLQQKYIEDFFAHLEELAKSELGVDAAARLGATLSKAQLAELYDEHIAFVEPDEILAIIESRGQGRSPA